MMTPQTVMKATGYWYMLFSVMMSFYPDKLLDAYKVEGADHAMNKGLMSLMGLQFSAACIACMIASRSNDKTISHVANANWVANLIQCGYTAVWGLKNAQAAGVPANGIYFNTAAGLILAFLNYQAHQETGAEKVKFLGWGQNAMVNCLRANQVCGMLFGLGCLFGQDKMIEQYMPGAPENVLPFIHMMLPTMGIMMVSNAFRHGALSLSEDEDVQYAGVRGCLLFWAFNNGMLYANKQLNTFIGNEGANDGYFFNFAMGFGFFYYCAQVLVAQDQKNKRD
jgi:hypothetical protein